MEDAARTARDFAEVAKIGISDSTHSSQSLKMARAIYSTWKLLEELLYLEMADYGESQISRQFVERRGLRALTGILNWLTTTECDDLEISSSQLIGFFRTRQFDKARQLLERNGKFQHAAILATFQKFPGPQEP